MEMRLGWAGGADAYENGKWAVRGAYRTRPSGAGTRPLD